MSTRSVTTITNTHGNSIALYRHHDGYPAAAGGALLDALRGATSAEALAGCLLSLKYDDARSVYELTGSADEHADLEHTYEVVSSLEGPGITFMIRHGKRRLHEGDWSYAVFSVRDFAGVVNKDRAEKYPNAALITLEGL